MRYDEVIKVRIIVIKKNFQPIVGASFEQNNSLSFYISIGFVHLLDKSVAQIVLRDHIFKIPQHICMKLQF